MTEKQLRSLSKVQLIDILYQQEREIERLNAELAKPRTDPEAAALLSGIMQAAQTAADSYVKNMVVAENEKIEGIAKLEGDARRRYEEAERHRDEANDIVRKILSDMGNVFNWQIEMIKTMRDGFLDKVNNSNLRELLPEEQQKVPVNETEE